MKALHSRPLWVLVGSGILGFRLGMVAYPNWQVAVEAAQVVAGLVKYPPGNTFYIYETKLWTILHQICALFLLSGVSEITLSKLLSGVTGMLSLQALSMCVFAMSRNVALAIGASLLVLATRSASNGVTYPILLMSTQHTYGSVGLSTFVLAAAALGSGLLGLGGFLVGVMPAVHPSWGLWLWILVALSLALDFRAARREFRPALTGFIAGAAVTTISLAVQLVFTTDVPRVDPAESTKYLEAFFAFWDGHRAPVSMAFLGVLVNEGALGVGVIWLAGFRDRLTSGATFLLRLATLSAALGLVMAYVSWIPPDRLPRTLVTLMPSRILNVDGMIVVALVIGLLGIYRDSIWARVLLAVFAIALLLSPRSMLWEWPPAAHWAWLQRGFDPFLVIELTTIGLLTVAAADLMQRRKHADELAVAAPDRKPTALARGLGTAMLAAMVLAGFLTLRLRPDTSDYFRDRTNDPFYATVAAEPDGLILTAGSFSFVQLYTRRPVLLDGALDSLTYAPEAGPEMARILRDVYGTDLLNPPPAARQKGVLPRALHRDLWEQTSLERWQQLRRIYDVHVILTPAEWQLQLPVAAEGRGLRLYRIPAPAS